MKTALSLGELANKLERIRKEREDFVIDTRAMRFEETGPKHPLVLNVADTKEFTVRPHALRQVGEHAKVPAQFADRLHAEHPDLLAGLLTNLLTRAPKRRLCRTLDGSMRAFLSDGYRIMDNHDLAEAVLPILVDGQAEVVSCEVTEAKLYIKVIQPELRAKLDIPPELRMGAGHNLFVEEVIGGLTISNSEIGAGRLSIQPSTFTLRCTNWASFKDESYGRVHLGKRASGDSEAAIWDVMSDDTRRKSDEALWSQVRDVTIASMDGRLFEAIVGRLRAARGETVKGDPTKFVERVASTFQLNETERGGVLEHLIRGGELSKYGLHAAITRAASDVESYDRASELETLGANVIDLPTTEWRRLAEAA